MNAVVEALAIIPPGRGPIRIAPRGWLEYAVRLLRRLGPYAVLALLPPGGSLLAILL